MPMRLLQIGQRIIGLSTGDANRIARAWLYGDESDLVLTFFVGIPIDDVPAHEIVRPLWHQEGIVDLQPWHRHLPKDLFLSTVRCPKGDLAKG